MKAGEVPSSRKDLVKDFDVSRPWLNRVIERAPRQILRAVDGISFTINRGETLSLVGESGCGKSTVARLICGLYAPSAGSILFAGTDLAKIAHRSDMLTMRRRFQMIFQDPYASLNPCAAEDHRRADPSHDLIKAEAASQARGFLTDGPPPRSTGEVPHEFSGGQRQHDVRRPCPIQPRVLCPTARSTCPCRRRS